MHAEERQERLELELKCKSEENDKAQRSIPTSCLDPLESKLGFSHMSIFSQCAERAARAATNGVNKGATFLLVFRCLNHTASSRKAFNGVQKGKVHSKKHKPSKDTFVDDRFRGHHTHALRKGKDRWSQPARKIGPTAPMLKPMQVSVHREVFNLCWRMAKSFLISTDGETWKKKKERSRKRNTVAKGEGKWLI